jgi:hypothetical protein
LENILAFGSSGFFSDFLAGKQEAGIEEENSFNYFSSQSFSH